MVSMRPLLFAAMLSGAASHAVRVDAQEVPPTPPLEVGAPAPDFALPGATRYGLLRDEVRLSDFAGQTVVLAFFFRARTRG